MNGEISIKPWMSDKQVNMIQSYCKSDHTMLEYGAGGSTLYFSKYVKKYISIEHDINWYNQIKKNDLNANIELHYCAPDNNIALPVWQAKPEDFRSYVSLVDQLPYKHYDRVLIDGRARVECAIKILDYISHDSIVFVHDFFERKRYHTLYDHYKLIDEDNVKQPSLAVFKKL